MPQHLDENLPNMVAVTTIYDEQEFIQQVIIMHSRHRPNGHYTKNSIVIRSYQKGFFFLLKLPSTKY